jgi:glucose/arabinose dehydrogenase
VNAFCARRAIGRCALLPALALLLAAVPVARAETLHGKAAFGDWRQDRPGVTRLIRPSDLPPPGETRSASASPSVVAEPAGVAPQVPAGFEVRRFAQGFVNPRVLRVAPNGDIFVAETAAGRIRVLRARDGATAPERSETFASGLDAPFGIAFYPPQGEARFVYVATENSVLRFPYRAGDMTARGPAQVIVPRLSPETGGHSTRDIAFSADGGTMFVSVGSASNVAQGVPRRSLAQAQQFEKDRGPGALWGDETDRAVVLAFDADGRNRRTFATGIRNCVGLAVQPAGGALWCATNERDGLGDDLPPDYATSVRQGGFYGWPWYYSGAHEDPRHKGARPDLAGKVVVPDVLIQPHSAPLQITFYHARSGAPAAFSAGYDGAAFVTLHGSWNRARRTGYKVVRLLMQDGRPTGAYEDFMTGFVLGDRQVWGRPVGIAVAHDGALLVSEDGNDTIWRIAPQR